MAALKPAELKRRLERPETLPPLILVYGPDRGLVSETARPVVTAVAGESADPFSVVSLTGEEAAQTPTRLVEEALTISLFGGRRAIHVRDAGTRDLSRILAPLTEAPPRDAVIVVEAGDIKKSAPLVKAWEKHADAIVVACYPDTAADLDRLIDEEAAAAGLAVERGARALLKASLGGDRLASRGEIVKLMLYARGAASVGEHHVREIVGDVSALGAEDAVDAAFLGEAARLDRELGKLWFAGTAPAQVASLAGRFAQTLARAAHDVRAPGDGLGVVRTLSPRVHFSRERAVAAMLDAWPVEALEAAAGALDRLVLATRLRPGLARPAVSEALHGIAATARHARRR